MFKDTVNEVVNVFTSVNDTCANIFIGCFEHELIVSVGEHEEVLAEWFKSYGYMVMDLTDGFLLVRDDV